ncbi:hypothetical protein G5714_024508 [Onychostoma macrolepis]|uniref:Uncharacterized protein n=1 Tax=Onychostoma macrolepis TaxID=369639 RepID=A0A7J6BJY4_9TELE|nr:hypothetical protein G5714_024508 [Onychostoma macrolepis]
MFAYFKSSDGSSALYDNDNIQHAQNGSHKLKGEVHNHIEESIRPYIDLIDNLRSVGIHKDLALPTIAVIGDQSSGKSSVLEALSGVALPRGSGIVTRCPLELRLKKAKGAVNWKAVLSYRDKKKEFVDTSLVENYIEEAQNELAGKGVGICDELITLEVMSPDVCDLTLIDLPGIARVPVKGQPENIEKQIKHLIMKFIEKQETLNLVVVPCNIDIATTEALKMAQEVDPDGKRTVAILTKPDLIDRGTETTILEIAQNKTIPLRKGYIMVKCRGQQQINEKMSLEEAAQKREISSKSTTFQVTSEKIINLCFLKCICLLNEDKATIKSLAIKLTHHLVDHIKTIKEFNEQINSISLGELIIKENLFVQLREEFKKWNNHLNDSKISLNNLTEEKITRSQDYRGRELLGFSNYRMFEKVLQGHVATLEDPAIYLLNTIKDIVIKQFTDAVNQCFQNYPALLKITMDKIYNIQSDQQEKAEQRIKEQFKMENMIFTQDPIHVKSLNEIGEDTFSEDQLPIFDKKSKYGEIMKAYYEIVVQRMSDQLPMMIMLFMLKQTAHLLSIDMLSLLEGANVSELLFEDSDVGRKRRDLHARLDRMSIAQEKMGYFV